MGRTDRRANTNIQEKKPPQENSAPQPIAEERPAPAEVQQPSSGWRWAALVWAIVFLFLMALALFDLVAGMFRG